MASLKTEIADTLTRPRHKKRLEIFGYRANIEGEMVVAWA
jgi:hypothetical protein